MNRWSGGDPLLRFRPTHKLRRRRTSRHRPVTAEGVRVQAREAAFGVLLRALRLERSLTIEALAEASGVSVRGISDLERERRAAPRQRTVAALADGLGLGEADTARLHAAAAGERTAAYSPMGVRSFPRSVEDFVGRTDEIRHLEALSPAAEEDGDAGSAGDQAAGVSRSADVRPVVVAIHGAPGAGKTTLGLRAARRLADRFPDGQIMVDLMGTDDSSPAPAELMVQILKAAGVPDRDLAKAGAQGRPALYRQALADRCCLLMLDNATDEAQVRPLLPGGGGSLAVVTSRRSLAGLKGVHHVPLADGLGGVGPLTAGDRRRRAHRRRRGRAGRGRRAVRRPAVAIACGQPPAEPTRLDRTPPGGAARRRGAPPGDAVGRRPARGRRLRAVVPAPVGARARALPPAGARARTRLRRRAGRGARAGRHGRHRGRAGGAGRARPPAVAVRRALPPARPGPPVRPRPARRGGDRGRGAPRTPA